MAYLCLLSIDKTRAIHDLHRLLKNFHLQSYLRKTVLKLPVLQLEISQKILSVNLLRMPLFTNFNYVSDPDVRCMCDRFEIIWPLRYHCLTNVAIQETPLISQLFCLVVVSSSLSHIVCIDHIDWVLNQANLNN